MKKTLVISGSPRKGGNSDILCDEFARGALESGNQVEKIWLGEKNINFCKACYYCRDRHVCFQKDDVKEILDKMLEADVIVMATPVYFYSIDAQMKALIDRTLPIWESIHDKDFYFIISSAEEDKEIQLRTLECFRGFLDCLEDVREKGVIHATGVYEKGEVESSVFMKQAYEMGKAI